MLEPTPVSDSIVVSATTIQTSTVYGGAGGDTPILGNGLSTQVVEGDFRGFAGNDSISANGSFVNTTVRAGSGNDTLFIAGRTASGEGSSNSAFYAGTGTDSLQISGRGTTIYGGTS